MLEIIEPEALNYNNLSQLIWWILSVPRNLILIFLPAYRSLDSLLCDLIVPILGLVFFLPMPRWLAAGSSFLSGWDCPFLTFYLLSLSSFHLFFDYVGVNISLKNSSSLFFQCLWSPIFSSLTDSIPTPFSFIFFLQKSLCSVGL